MITFLYYNEFREEIIMPKVAVITDSNSGITQAESKELGIYVLPMPFYIDEKLYFEDIDLSQEQFYEMLENDSDISTSQPAPTDVTDLWDKILEEYDQIVHIPMSSGLSGSYQTAAMLAGDYEGKVFVVNNQRISITQRQSAIDALAMANKGMDGEKIKDILEKTKFESSIYIMVETMKYLKKGGRVTPAAATLATLFRIKPVLQIHGEKLDAFAKVRTVASAKQTILDAIIKDCNNEYGPTDDKLSNMNLGLAYTGSYETIREFHEELKKKFPEHEIICQPLSLSVACHIGLGAIAMTATKKLDI